MMNKLALVMLVSSAPALAQFQPVQMGNQGFNPGFGGQQQGGMAYGGANMMYANQGTAFSGSAGFIAPQQQMIGEQPAYISAGNGCAEYRNGNTRLQNGALVPQQGGGAHIFGG